MNGISGVLHFKAKGSSFSIPLLSLAMVHSWAGEGGGVGKLSGVCG